MYSKLKYAPIITISLLSLFSCNETKNTSKNTSKNVAINSKNIEKSIFNISKYSAYYDTTGEASFAKVLDIYEERDDIFVELEDFNTGGGLTFALSNNVKIFPKIKNLNSLRKLIGKEFLVTTKEHYIDGQDKKIITELIHIEKRRFSNGGFENSKEPYIFLQKLKSAVRNNNFSAISSTFSYPITIEQNNTKKSYKNSHELLVDSKIIFNNAIRSAIVNQQYSDFLVNQYGMMIGDGEIWITATKKGLKIYKYSPFPLLKYKSGNATINSLTRLFENEFELSVNIDGEKINFQVIAQELNILTRPENFFHEDDGMISLDPTFKGKKRTIIYKKVKEMNEMTEEIELINKLINISK